MLPCAALPPVAHPLVGMWALHCHIDLHANSGMLMAFKVAAPGAKEPWSLPKGITSCGAQNRWVQEEGGLLPCQPVACPPTLACSLFAPVAFSPKSAETARQLSSCSLACITASLASVDGSQSPTPNQLCKSGATCIYLCRLQCPRLHCCTFLCCITGAA